MRIFKLFLATSLSLMTLTLSAQTVELEQDVDQDTVIAKFGKNRKHYISTFISGEVFTQDVTGDTLSTKAFQSVSWNYGMYYKYRVSQAYSLVTSLSYGLDIYEYQVDEGQFYNRMNLGDAALELVNRINFGRRGNVIGNYFEFGASASYLVSSKRRMKVETGDGADHRILKTEQVGLRYINPFNYAAHARLGFNKIAITAQYRLSDLTKSDVTYDMPPLAIGLRLDFGA